MNRFRSTTRGPTCSITIDGTPATVPLGITAAGALLLSGHLAFGRHPVTGEPEGPWCQIGVCFGCLVEIDGTPGRQACLVAVTNGMAIRTHLAAGPA